MDSPLARIMGAASLLALLPLAAASAAPSAASERFSAPRGPLVLTRTLRRPLAGGAEIVSTRSYEIRIVADGDGYVVEGKLVNSEVTAPPSLAALAALERTRPDSGPFPFRLDRDGMIASAAVPNDRSAEAAAAAAGRSAIASSALAEADRREAQAVIDQLTSRSGATGARWPSDLFHPAPGLRSQTSRFDLGDGRTGSVTTTIEARRGASGNSIERTVVTETGDAQRATHETYTLAPRQG
jgi:hypothetical protein